VLLQLLLGLQCNYLVSKLATFEGNANACWYVFLQFELELGNAVVEAPAVGQCFKCCCSSLLVTMLLSFGRLGPDRDAADHAGIMSESLLKY